MTKKERELINRAYDEGHSDGLQAAHDLLDRPAAPTAPEIVSHADPLARGIEINPLGGRQSKVEGKYDLIDWNAFHRLAHVLSRGAVKRGVGNWRLISRRDHLNHLLFHAANALEQMDKLGGAGVDDLVVEENLDRVFCRAMMAIGAKH